MPSYNVACTQCDYEATENLKISETDAWDLQATCPICQASGGKYRRVIRQAAAIRGGAKGTERSGLAKKLDSKERFVKSGEKDAMLHKQALKTDRNQIAEAREIVKSGKYEGF